MVTRNIKQGFLPGGEDRVQWVFEEEWTDEMMQPLLNVVSEHIQSIRDRHGFDVTNYFEFSYSDLGGSIGRVFYATRRQWRFHLQAFSPEELAGKVKEQINK